MSSTNLRFLVAFVLGGAAGTIVFFHATRNEIKHPSAWATFVFAALLLGLPTYLLYVRWIRRGPTERT